MPSLRSLLSMLLVAAVFSVAPCASVELYAAAVNAEASKPAETVAKAPAVATEGKVNKTEETDNVVKPSVEATDTVAPMPMALQAQAEPSESVLALLKAQKGIDRFVSLLLEDGHEKLLIDPKAKVTVFAPTDAAMDQLPQAIADKLDQDPAARHQFVSYHMIVGSVIQTGNLKGRQIAPFTAAGAAVSIDGLGHSVTVNGAPIVLADIQAPGGILQVLGGVLLPPQLTPIAPEDLVPPKQEKGAPPLAASVLQKHEALVAAAGTDGAEMPAPAKSSLWDRLVVRARAFWQALKAKFF